MVWKTPRWEAHLSASGLEVPKGLAEVNTNPLWKNATLNPLIKSSEIRTNNKN